MRIHPDAPLNRRTLLRAAGVALSLPWLECMTPRRASVVAAEQTAKSASPRRMLVLCTPFGILPQYFFPSRTGLDHGSSPYLDVVADFHDRMTVFSGVSHPDVDGGHASESSFLTAAPHPGSSSFKNSISLDQFAAERVGAYARFPYLALGCGNSRGLAWTAGGVQIPADTSPSKVFAKLFVDGTPDEVRGQVRRLQQGQSILDTVRDHAERLQKNLGPRDREKLDQYFTGIRQLEVDMVRGQEWAQTPKPPVKAAPPEDNNDPADVAGRTRLMNDLACLALETDSTRIVTLFISSDGIPPIDGVSQTHHILSHHGNNDTKLTQLQKIQFAQMTALRELLHRLRSTSEAGSDLLEQTMVLYGSNLGNANNHSTRNMPVLLAGGGFRHAGHLAFDATNNYPLPNLYLSMLQRLGIEVDRFASSTGTMTNFGV